jgi:hypothetical protein
MQNRDPDTTERELPSTTEDEDGRVYQEKRRPVVFFDPYFGPSGAPYSSDFDEMMWRRAA